MLRAAHGRQLGRHGAQRAAGREGEDQRLAAGEVGGEKVGGADRDARGRGLRRGIGRLDGAVGEPEALPQRLAERHRLGQRVVEPELDQLLADGERHQPLRRLARQAELLRDLVLRVAGDVVEPRRARREVELALPPLRPVARLQGQPPLTAPIDGHMLGCASIAKRLGGR